MVVIREKFFFEGRVILLDLFDYTFFIVVLKLYF